MNVSSQKQLKLHVYTHAGESSFNCILASLLYELAAFIACIIRNNKHVAEIERPIAIFNVEKQQLQEHAT